MQTDIDKETQSDLVHLAEYLVQHGLGSLTAWVLEAGGPLALLGAQLLHFGNPLLRSTDSSNTLSQITRLLENEEVRVSFISYLRGEGPS